MPWMTLALSITCLLLRVLYGLMTPMQQRMFIEAAGANPATLSQGNLEPSGLFASGAWWPLLLSLFIHSSWLHLIGNMAYLWVFGMPVERRLGPMGLVVVFLLGGALANLIVAVQMPQLDTPVIGASGAVSAVVGAYLAMFPGRRIGLYLPLGMFVQFVQVSALLVIGSWFTLQLVYSLFGPMSRTMAWWTHLAGFAVGLIFALLVRALSQLKVR
jgi:membrane associated rhomboid family serine protease